MFSAMCKGKVLALSTQNMHNLCMAHKTISVSEQAYAQLLAAKRRRSESFSQVVMRAVWPDVAPTGPQLLRALMARRVAATEAELDKIEAADATDSPAPDKWQRT